MKTIISTISQEQADYSFNLPSETEELEFNKSDEKIDVVGLFVKATILCFSLYFLFEVFIY